MDAYIYNSKQVFNDNFMPSKSCRGVEVEFKPTGNIEGTANPTMIQFVEIAPRSFSDVIQNIRLNINLQLSLSYDTYNNKFNGLKQFNYGIRRTDVQLNGTNALSLPNPILAPIYENYNTKFYTDIYQNNFDKKDEIITSYNAGAAGGNIIINYLIETPIYHPWLTAPYLAGVNNMSITMDLNLSNLIINTLDQNKGNYSFVITSCELVYDTYHTEQELFNIALPYFKIFEKSYATDTGANQGSLGTIDTKTAPLKIFINGQNDYKNTSVIPTENCIFNNIQFNVNNIYNAYKSNTLNKLYQISKNAGYIGSFREFSNVKLANGPSYMTVKTYYKPQCVAIDLKYLDIDIGTNDIFRFDATTNQYKDNYTSGDFTSTKIIGVIYMYYSLYSSSRTQTTIIIADDIGNRNLLLDFDYENDILGFGFFDKIKKGINWLKNKKLISTVADVVGKTAGAINPAIGNIANTVSNVSKNLGFGTQAF